MRGEVWLIFERKFGKWVKKDWVAERPNRKYCVIKGIVIENVADCISTNQEKAL
jgi:hypothetical protein